MKVQEPAACAPPEKHESVGVQPGLMRSILIEYEDYLSLLCRSGPPENRLFGAGAVAAGTSAIPDELFGGGAAHGQEVGGTSTADVTASEELEPDIPSEDDVDELLKSPDLADHQIQAKKLLDALRITGEFSWTKNKNILLRGNAIPDTNVVSIIRHYLKGDDTASSAAAPPTGMKDFLVFVKSYLKDEGAKENKEKDVTWWYYLGSPD